ncbi:GAF and ANTAR domain-containing protein [Georgenia sp. SUBG003]|uniref:GAF and ANTAR domain-containing protein n=1 Tax=Georgenia sp. SUBG003 TaxID=1497974 RepID=UPI0004D8034E|nr:hypothetical protein DA06_13715 [Georgenia sp. SUBG003]
MYDHDLFVKTLSDFVRTLVEPYDTDAVLDDLATTVRETLHLTGAGVSLADDGGIRRATVIPPHLVPLEDYQQEHQTGPSVDAFRTSRPVVASGPDELRARWPRYAELALECGTAAVAALPLALGGKTFGALSMYADRRDWPEPDLTAAALLGEMAAAYLVHESVHQQQQQLASQLTQALRSRIVIEQAKGILAEANGETVEHAFERIRSHARSHSVKVRDVSEAIVRMGLRL